MIRSRLLGAAVSVLVLGGHALSSMPAAAAASPAGPVVVQSLKNDRSAPLRDEQQGQVGPNDKSSHPYRALRPRNSNGKGPSSSGPVQTAPGVSAMPATSTNWEGVNNIDGVLPPDTNGDIGPNDYVQWVNLHYQIWTRAGVSRLGPSAGNTLWSGFGGVCETTNQGDPVVRHDRMADRWIFSQFAFNVDGNGNPVAPYVQCFAVSTTGDPTGTYYRYAFQISTVTFNDYPKLAVWPDGYYMTFNYFDLSLPPANQFVGAGAWAFDRSKMLNGQPTTAITFTTGAAYGGLLPSDLDSSILPPAGSPNYVAAVDTNVAPSGSTLQLWKFHVDFATPANSTFGTASHTPDYNLAVPMYRWYLCSGSQNCLAQPGTSRGLDPIADRLMNRLPYRRFTDGHESLVANHTVGVGASGNQAAIRWYEIRNLSTVPTIYQQGTYSPSTDNRWMGSIAMDQAGDIALGYSVSSTTVSPSIRYSGRLASDTLGMLPQGEATLIAGSGSQTSQFSRWGDYSMMAVDPSDNCTFWYTQQYYTATSDRGWQTRTGSFRFPNCATPTAPTGVSAAAGDASATVSWTAPASDGGSPVTGYRVTPFIGAGAQTPSIFNSTATTHNISGLTNGTTYTFKVAAINAAGTGPDSVASNTVTPTAPYVAGVVGTDSGLWVLKSGSSSFTPEGGVLLGALAVVSIPQTSGPGFQLYVGTGSDHDLYVRNDSQGWQRLLTSPVSCIDNPAGVVIGSTLYVACQGSDHALWHAESAAPSGSNLPTVNRSAWQSLGGILTFGPAVALVAGTATYAVVGSDQGIYIRTLSTGYVKQGAWKCTGHPALASASTTAYFACHGIDDALYYSTNSGASWAEAVSLGGVLIDGPGIAATSSGPIFFGEGSDNALYHRTLTGGWSRDGGKVEYGAAATAI